MWPLRSQRQPAIRSPLHGLPGMLAIMAHSHDQNAVFTFAKRSGWDVTVVSTLSEASAVLARWNIAVIILDRDLPESDWQSTVHSFAQHTPPPCIILASSVMDEYLFEETVRQGGFDTVAKPIRPDELRRITGLALTFWKSRTGLTE